MKTKYVLFALLLVASSNALYAQDRLQKFSHENSLNSLHQQMLAKSHGFNIPLSGNNESWDELLRHQVDLNSFRTEGNPHKFAQNANEPVYFCDSAFSYNIADVQAKTIYTRDRTGKVLIMQTQTWNSGEGVWLNKQKNSYSYDNSGNRLMTLYQKWNAEVSDWANELKVNYTNDASGNNITQLNQVWESGIWVNNAKYSFEYDASGNMLTTIYQKWDTGISNWLNLTKNIYTYDGSGNRLSILGQKWENEFSIWVDEVSGTYAYNAAGNLLGQHSKLWNSEISDWENNYKSTYTYDASEHKLSELHQLWNIGTSNWVNWYTISYAYETEGNILSQVQQEWNNEIGEWENRTKIDFEYNYNIQKIIATQNQWSGEWIPTNFGNMVIYIFNNHLININGYKGEVFYSSYSLGIKDKDINSEVNTNFCSPNPANELINITNLYEKKAVLKIYTMKGQLLSEKMINAGHNQISVNNLTAGIYLFILQSENSRIQNKVVVY